MWCSKITKNKWDTCLIDATIPCILIKLYKQHIMIILLHSQSHWNRKYKTNKRFWQKSNGSQGIFFKRSNKSEIYSSNNKWYHKSGIFVKHACKNSKKRWHWAKAYLIFVTSTTSSAGVKIFRLVSKKCDLVCFGVKIMNFVFFGVKKSGISVFLVSV